MIKVLALFYKFISYTFSGQIHNPYNRGVSASVILLSGGISMNSTSRCTKPANQVRRRPKGTLTAGALVRGGVMGRRRARLENNENNNKVRTAVWLRPTTIEDIDHWMKRNNCETRSEFIVLGPVLSSMIRGILENNNNRLRSLLFKWAVELNMACHTIAAHFRVDDIDRQALRKFAVDEVKKTCGQVSFDHALDVQRRIPVKDDTKWPG